MGAYSFTAYSTRYTTTATFIAVSSPAIGAYRSRSTLGFQTGYGSAGGPLRITYHVQAYLITSSGPNNSVVDYTRIYT